MYLVKRKKAFYQETKISVEIILVNVYIYYYFSGIIEKWDKVYIIGHPWIEPYTPGTEMQWFYQNEVYEIFVTMQKLYIFP